MPIPARLPGQTLETVTATHSPGKETSTCTSSNEIDAFRRIRSNNEEENPLLTNSASSSLRSEENIKRNIPFKAFKSDGVSKAYQEMLGCINAAKQKSLHVSPVCLSCVDFFNLFPHNHVIDHDTLIQLWMAEGLVTEEPMEDIGAAYLKALREHGGFIYFLKEDHSTGKIWYKVGQFTLARRLIELYGISPLRVVSDYSARVFNVKPKPCHVTLQHLPRNGLQALARYAHIKTISLLKDHKSNIELVPYNFFISLKSLHTLNLSGTRLSELPSSIGSATCLHFLDLSETLIRRLPETIDALENLQTLKLQNCTRLAALPKGIKRLTALRHLEFTTGNLRCMPPGLGALTNLHTLSEFIVGHQRGCHVDELKNMNELGGKLCLSKLEHITSVVDAEQAYLSSKHRLKRLELRWSDNTDQESIGVNNEVTQHLRPHTNLQDLRVLCFNGSAFPSWISNPSYTKLVNITIFKCDNCKLLPALGQLQSLESLSLIDLTRVEIIDFRFCLDETAATVHDNFIAFPALQKLEIKSMHSLKEWKDMGKSSFPRLLKLSIRECPELTAICKLSNITTLEYVEMNHCKKLPSFPASDLPASVKTLVIESCPMLSLTSYTNNSQHWHKTQHDANLAVYQHKDEEEANG